MASTALHTVAFFSGKHRHFVRLGGVMGASAVILGAVGTHRSATLDANPDLKPVFETANKFHFLHSLAMFTVPFCRYPMVAGGLLATGTTLFCGSLYYHSFTDEHKFGKVAAAGGSILILGWLSMAL